MRQCRCRFPPVDRSQTYQMVSVCTVTPHGISHLKQDSTFWMLILEHKSKLMAVFLLIQHTQRTYWNLSGHNSFWKRSHFCHNYEAAMAQAEKLWRKRERRRRERAAGIAEASQGKKNPTRSCFDWKLFTSKSSFHRVPVVKFVLTGCWLVKVRHWKASTRSSGEWWVQSKAGLSTDTHTPDAYHGLLAER